MWYFFANIYTTKSWVHDLFLVLLSYTWCRQPPFCNHIYDHIDCIDIDSFRTDLIAKIEAGEGVETALNQLNQEKAGVQAQLEEAHQQMHKQSTKSQVVWLSI